MKKEEFLAFSLPYGLKLKGFDGSIAILTNGSGIDFGRYSLEWVLRSNKCKPILHPLSDLTKEIEHNGEKFVPIIILAEIGFNVSHDDEIKVKSDNNISGCLFYNEDNEKTVFVYHHETKSFGAHYHDDKKYTNTHYQLYMFQKLIEWKFDVSGLIEKGEAIDVNTLNENPYK